MRYISVLSHLLYFIEKIKLVKVPVVASFLAKILMDLNQSFLQPNFFNEGVESLIVEFLTEFHVHTIKGASHLVWNIV